MKKFVTENIIKNLIIVVLLIPGYLFIQEFFFNSPFSSDKTTLGNILTCVSILAVTACFGNFSFTYEKVDRKNQYSRLLAHLTTGLLMLLIGLSLEMTSVVLNLLVGNFIIFNLALVILYLASVLYDFWDLMRENNI